MAPMGPGFRFHPTDEELVGFYLKRKITGNLYRYDHIAVVDVYKLEPWDLPSRSKLKTKDLEWYFFSPLDRKYGNGSRTNRATEKGYWKTTGKDRSVIHGDRTVGMKKTLVYHVGRAPHGRRTNWVMHEYKMVDEELARAGTVLDVFVVCRIFEKSGAGPKNGAKYGAPLDEKEWDVEEWDVEEENKQEVAPLLPAIPHNVVAPLLPAIPHNVVAPPPAIADDGFFYVVANGDYVETNDLEKELNLSDIIGTVTFPSPKFYHGESSTHAEHSQECVKDQEPLAGSLGISGTEIGQLLYMAEKRGVGTDPMEDEYYEMSEVGNYLSNFTGSMDDMDLNRYFDAIEYPPNVDEGSFLETNDLAIGNEDNLTDADPSWNAMVDEYLALSDYPQIPESENSIPNQGSPFTQQNVEGETADKAVVSKHGSETQTSNEASSAQNTEEGKLVPGKTNPVVKQAYGWLASIPAAPAHAMEFPAKEIALGLHPAAQSSHPAHITTGMITITDITFTDNARDWRMGKDGGFNSLISTRFSQPGVNPSALMPVSGKTAFLLSHGWIFLTGFSVVILSLSFKIGSIMYTGK